MKQAGEKEYYLATACSEMYAPPSAYLSLRGFVTGGERRRTPGPEGPWGGGLRGRQRGRGL